MVCQLHFRSQRQDSPQARVPDAPKAGQNRPLAGRGFRNCGFVLVLAHAGQSRQKLRPTRRAHLDTTTTPAEGSRPTGGKPPCRPRALTRRAASGTRMVVVSRCALFGFFSFFVVDLPRNLVQTPPTVKNTNARKNPVQSQPSPRAGCCSACKRGSDFTPQRRL